MKKLTALTIVFALVMSLMCVTASADNTTDFVSNPVVLDFDDYSPSQSVSEYLTSKGWGGTMAEISGGKGKLYGTNLSYVTSVGFDPDAAANLDYYLVMEYDAAFTDFAESETIADNTFPVVGSGTAVGSNRAVRGDVRWTSGVKFGFLTDNLTLNTTSQDTARSEMTHTWVYDFGENGKTTATALDYYVVGGINDQKLDTSLYSQYTGGDPIQYLSFTTNSGKTALVDNIKIYAANKTFALNGTNFSETNVALDKELEFTFNNPVLPSSLDVISVSKGGSAVDKSEYTVSLAKDSAGLNRIVKIKFNAGMSAETDYNVTFPQETFKDGARSALASDVTKSFKTISLPEFALSVNANKTLEEAAGNGIKVTVTAQNKESEAASALILVGLYDDSDNLVKFASLSKSFSAGESESFEYSFSVPSAATGYSIKAMACANILNLTEYASATLGGTSNE